ncbi:MAG: site-specific DNA-methyltransferase [Parabacteroides sp.]|nr:site-specific DNA-methyltransferase [Parabacteroides sp.]
MTFLEILEKTLLQDERFIAEDGKVLKAKVYDAAMAMDEDLLHLLLSEQVLKDHFFKKVNDTFIFDKVEFTWVLNSREFLPESYTMYKNKIGLVDSSGDLISQKQDVTLVWPYKDCVLEGGQTKDDEKRDEVFYNETLAPDQVTRLLYPKALANAKRYSYAGDYDLTGKAVGGEGTVTCEETTEFLDDDNMIVKGNNLLALSSLLRRYEGKVKLIYIDPPYYFNKNISEDSFKYNSNFHLSSWLTFLKNRLTLAWDLLAPKGTIWIHIGEDGMHYLKVLADDVFGKEHFVATLPRKTRDGKSDVPFNLSQDFDFILVYAKADESDATVGRNVKRKYYETDDFPGRLWRTADMTSQRTIYERPNSNFTMVNPKTGKEYPVNPKRSWAVTEETFETYYQAGGIGFPDDYDFMSGERPFRRVFKDEDDQNQKPTAVYSDFLLRDFIENLMLKTKNKDGNDEIDALFTRDEFDYAKPENLIKSLLEVTTQDCDLILDFFMGSATTQAVALKMNRRFIGIEQMDYINTVSVPRLCKVVEGEQGGISKDVDWSGGGSFVYCELAERSETLIKQLQSAEDSKPILAILDEATEKGLLRPSVLPDDLKKTREEFLEFSLDEQRRLVMELLDKNKLYVNLCDMEDENMSLSESSKAFTRSFYNLDKDTEV